MLRVVIPLIVTGALAAGAKGADGVKPPHTDINTEAPACSLISTHELEEYLGVPAIVEESRGGTGEAGLCSWSGGNAEVTVSLMFFPGASHGLPDGTERAYFDQMIETEKQKYHPGEFVAVPELADDAWAVDLADNPNQYFAVYLFKGKDNVTVATTGLGLEATVEVARLAELGM